MCFWARGERRGGGDGRRGGHPRRRRTNEQDDPWSRSGTRRIDDGELLHDTTAKSLLSEKMAPCSADSLSDDDENETILSEI